MKKLSLIPIFAFLAIACGGGGHHGGSSSTNTTGIGTTGVADHTAVALGFEIDGSGNNVAHVATFHTNTPSTFLTDVAVTGVDTGDVLAAVDRRPTTGVLYAAGAHGTLYTLDPATGAATKVGATNPIGIYEVADMDFDPTGSQVRVSSFYNNARLDPATGVQVANDPQLTLDSNDVEVGGIAYAPSGTLYTYGFTRKLLKTEVPNSGVLSGATNAMLPFFALQGTNNPTNEVGMDISSDGKTAILASFGVKGSYIVLVDIATGTQRFVGATPNDLSFQVVSVAFDEATSSN